MKTFGHEMKRVLLRGWPIFLLHIGCLFLLFSGLCVRAEETHDPLRVLMLFDEGSDLIALDLVEESFETTLRAGTTKPVEFYHEYLDASRFRDTGHYKLFADYLRAKFSGMKLDLFIPIIGARVDWASHIPRKLYPDVPIVFGSCLSSGAVSIPLVSEMTGVMFSIDVVKGLETSLSVRPRTKRVIVVAGPEGMHSELIPRINTIAASHPKIEFEYWTDRTASQIFKSAAALSNDSLIFYIELFRDSEEESFVPWQFGRSLARVASAPVFGIYESYLDTGIVGGEVVNFTSLGVETARQALRVLNGERASIIPVMKTSGVIPMFDWRAMQRWGIAEADLPDGSIVRFRPPPLWETHRLLLIAGSIWIIVLLIVVLVLVLSRLRRRRVEVELQQNEERLRLALELSSAGIWALDLSTEHFWMTTETSVMFGFTPNEEVNLQQLLTVIHPADLELFRRAIDKAVIFGESGRIEYRIVLPDASVRWILSQGRTHCKQPGHPNCLMGVSLDITEVKASEEKILQQKEFSDTLINSLPGIYYLYDHKWRLIRWNRNHETFTGFSTEEMDKRELLEWFSPPYKDLMAGTIRKVFEEGEATVEVPLLLKDGSQVPYFFTGVRLKIDGEIYFLGLGLDISLRKGIEQDLLRNEKQLRLITDSLPAIIAYVDSDQRYLWVNKTFEDWKVYPRDKIQGKHIRDVLGEDEYAKLRHYVETVLTGKLVTFETVMSHPKMGPRDVLVNYVPDVVTEHETRGFFALVSDITDIRNALRQSQQDRDALAHVARVSIISELGTSLAHEINQPLAAILNNAQAGLRFLKNKEPDLKEIEEIFTDIVADDKRAGNIIHRMRDFIRKDLPQREFLDINGIIEDVLNILHSEMLINDILIRTDFATDLPHVLSDRVQLEQVLINLIVNAEQAMNAVQTNPCTLVIKTAKNSKGRIVVYIQDTGPGIAEDMLERVFEPFYTTKVGGIGMGLSISRSIVEANKGRIWAENAPEGGTRFCITLPTGDFT